MRIAYLDCFSGIAGDMFLGALIDAGVPEQVLHRSVQALQLDAALEIESVHRSGMVATKAHVLEAGHPAERNGAPHKHSHGPEHDHPPHKKHAEHSHGPAGAHLDAPVRPKKKKHDHPEKHGRPHAHTHGRSLTDIRALIEGAALDEAVQRFAIHAFELLGRSEAKVHGVPLEQVHFHEVGAVDAIVDIVAASAGIHHLAIDAWHCSAVNTGSGTVECAHGTFPVPAPATADLLRGMPTYAAHVEKELTTPTGAALLRTLHPVFGAQPPMRVDAIGYGAGTRDPKGFPNVLRLSVGERAETAAAGGPELPAASHPHEGERVAVLETALDDLSPQLLAHAMEQTLTAGALDAMMTPVIMKKGRPGTLLTVLCNPRDAAALQAVILRETSTLGVRLRHEHRACLERSYKTVQTAYGEVRIKLGCSNGEQRNAAPEFEDCRTAAAQHNVAVKQVQQAAIAAFLR